MRGAWPRGHRETLTDEWRHRILAELERRKMTQRALARAVGCSPGSITNVLKMTTHGGQMQAMAKIVQAMAKILGVPLPSAATGQEDHAEFILRVRAKLQWAIVNRRKDYDSLEIQLLGIIAELRAADVQSVTPTIKSDTDSAEEDPEAGAGDHIQTKGGTKRQGKPHRRRTRGRGE